MPPGSDQLVETHLSLARREARRYRHRGVEDDDLEQVAMLALVRATRAFRDEVGDFPAYAVPCVRGALRRHFRDLGWGVRPPRSLQELQPRLVRAEEELRQELGREPTAAELAARVGCSEQAAREAGAARSAFRPVPIPQDWDRDHLDPGLTGVEDRAVLRPLLRTCTPLERRVLGQRFLLGRSQSHIGRDLDLGQRQVSRVLDRVLARLRDEAGVEPSRRGA